MEGSLLEAWLNNNDLLNVEEYAISLIPSEFWASPNQNESPNGDICSEETKWATLGGEEIDKRIDHTFYKPTPEMVKHLKPLYARA